MNKYLFSKVTYLLFLFNGYCQLSQPEHAKVVESFVNCIKAKDVDYLHTIISYPYKRTYPIPPITNKFELQNHYEEIFDDNLSAIISKSDIKEDWTAMGWRGIMLNRGIVWIDYDGKFLGTNYISQSERALKKKWITYERNLLHESLKDFEQPVLTIESTKFIIRIDQLINGKYRYASWSKHKGLLEKPDLILNNGKEIFEGSGGNHHYTFKNGAYNYTIYVNVLRPKKSSPYRLVVTKNNETTVLQPADIKPLK